MPGIKAELVSGHKLWPTAICLPKLPFLPSPISMKSPSPRYFERLAKVASCGSQSNPSGTATAGVGCHLLSGPGCWWHCPPFTKQPKTPSGALIFTPWEHQCLCQGVISSTWTQCKSEVTSDIPNFVPYSSPGSQNTTMCAQCLTNSLQCLTQSFLQRELDRCVCVHTRMYTHTHTCARAHPIDLPNHVNKHLDESPAQGTRFQTAVWTE